MSGNNNCLKGIQCPACGNEDTFYVSTRSLATLTDEGIDHASDHDWDDTSYARCAECDEDGQLAEFRNVDLDPRKALGHLLRTLIRVYPHLLDSKMLAHDAARIRRMHGLLTGEANAEEDGR